MATRLRSMPMPRYQMGGEAIWYRPAARLLLFMTMLQCWSGVDVVFRK
jgi:hypothetical protein